MTRGIVSTSYYRRPNIWASTQSCQPLSWQEVVNAEFSRPSKLYSELGYKNQQQFERDLGLF
jgi:hypothetical protein